MSLTIKSTTSKKTEVSKKSTEKTPLFVINGISVFETDIFLLKDKKDENAPTGFVAQGVSKLPSDGVDETFNFAFMVRTQGVGNQATTGVYDTGFFPESACYRNWNPSEAKIAAESRTKNILEPYQKTMANSKLFTQEDPESIDVNNFVIESGMVLSMKDPEQRMLFYAAMLTYSITPIQELGNPKYRHSFYCFVEMNKARTHKEDMAFAKVNAIGTFKNLMDSDKETIFLILSYMNIDVSKKITDAALTAIFIEKIIESQNQIEPFLEAVDKASETKGREQMEIYQFFRANTGKNSDIIKQSNGMYSYKGVEVGEDLRSSARALANNPALLELKNAILLNE